MLNASITHSIIDYCHQHLEGIEAIYLFGSQVTGQVQKNSDIDIAVLRLEPLSAEVRWELSQGLAVLLNQDVDLIDLQHTSTVMQLQITQSGKRIFDIGSKRTDFFETYVLCEYVRLCELRHNIIEDIRKRGSVYGE